MEKLHPLINPKATDAQIWAVLYGVAAGGQLFGAIVVREFSRRSGRRRPNSSDEESGAESHIEPKREE